MSRITWRAMFRDGTQLTEPKNDEAKTYLTIDRVKLSAMQVIEIDEAPGWEARVRVLLSVTVHPYRRIFFRRRGEHALPVGPAGEKGFQEVMIIGWEEDLLVGAMRDKKQAIDEEQAIRVELVTRRTIAAVFPDGSIEIRDKFDKGRWFYDFGEGEIPDVEKALEEELAF